MTRYYRYFVTKMGTCASRPPQAHTPAPAAWEPPAKRLPQLSAPLPPAGVPLPPTARPAIPSPRNPPATRAPLPNLEGPLGTSAGSPTSAVAAAGCCEDCGGVPAPSPAPPAAASALQLLRAVEDGAGPAGEAQVAALLAAFAAPAAAELPGGCTPAEVAAAVAGLAASLRRAGGGEGALGLDAWVAAMDDEGGGDAEGDDEEGAETGEGQLACGVDEGGHRWGCPSRVDGPAAPGARGERVACDAPLGGRSHG